MAELFAPELAARTESEARATLAALDVVSSWESHDLLRHDQGLSRGAAAATMGAAIAALLAGG